jgi:putative MATE family efflux protein
MSKQLNNQITKGVQILLGDPKKALFRLAIPIIAGNIFHTLYNITDAIWVSGLGSNALTAIGLYFPFFFVAMAIGMGIGIGGGSAISRSIGARQKKRAGNIATHTLSVTLIIAVIFTFILILSIKPIYALMHLGPALKPSLDYANVIIYCTIFIFFGNIGAAILRAEGDAKRAMLAMIFGTGLNILLDPIFIYIFDLGVAGAAWATLLSLAIASLLIAYWLFFQKNTFVEIKYAGFSMRIIKRIFKVGFPATIQHLAVALNTFVLNIIIVQVSGPDGVAILATGWRVIMLGSTPVFGIGAAIVSLCGAAYGAKDFQKLNVSFNYAIKVAIMIEICAAIFIIFFAKYIILVFTYTQSSVHLKQGLIRFLRITSCMYPAMALGPISSSFFQSIGKGFNALFVTILRTIILTIPFVYCLAIIFNVGLDGIWLGMVIANTIGASIAFAWAQKHLRNLGALRSDIDLKR